MNFKKIFSFSTLSVVVLLCSKINALSCSNLEAFKDCINQNFDKKNDICLYHNCQEILNNNVVCSEPIFDIYKASLSLFCSKNNNGAFCPYHDIIGKAINYENISETIEMETALKNAISATCNVTECKTVFYEHVKTIILNSILIGDKHYEDISTNELYKELVSICD